MGLLGEQQRSLSTSSGELRVRRLRAFILAFALMLVLPAVMSAGLAFADEPSAAGAPVVCWHADIGREIGREITIDGGEIAAATIDRHCLLLDLASGLPRWNTGRRAGLQSGARLWKDAVFTVSDAPDGRLFCLDRVNGTERWNVRVGETAGAPLVEGESVYAASISGRVVAANCADGHEIWRARVSGMVRAPLACDDSLLFVPTIGDSVIALRRADGTVAWSQPSTGSIYGAPLVFAGRLWSLSYPGQLTAREPSSGQVMAACTLPGSFYAGLTAARDRLIALSTSGECMAVATDSLDTIWSVKLGSVGELRPTIHGSIVWVGLRDGSVYGLNIDDGREVARLHLAAPICAPIAVEKDRVVIAAGKGMMWAYRWSSAPGDDHSPAEESAQAEQPQSGALSFDSSASLATAAARSANNVSLQLPTRRAELAASSAKIEIAPLTLHPSGLYPSERRSAQPKTLRWLATGGWLAGTAGALWLQFEADREYDRYESAGDPGRRDHALNRAEDLDRAALGSWLVSEAFFALGLWAWLDGD